MVKATAPRLVDAAGLAVFPIVSIVTYFMIRFSRLGADWPDDFRLIDMISITVGAFHVWLWITAGILFTVKIFPNLQKTLFNEVKFGWSRARLLFALWVCGLVLFQTMYWQQRYGVAGGDRCAKQPVVCYSKAVGKEVGRVVEPLLGLALIPVARNSILDRVFDISYLNLIEFHRAITWMFVLGTIIHSICYILAAVYDQSKQSWQSNLFNAYDARFAKTYAARNSSYLNWGNGNWMTLMGFIATTLMVPIASTSLYWCRRKAYNLFYLVHMLAPVLLVFAWLHVVSLFYFSLPGLCLYIIDCITRILVRFTWHADVIGVRFEVGGLLSLSVDVSHRLALQNAKSDSFVRICVPEVSRWEWHPFTIIQNPDQPNTISLLVATNSTNNGQLNWCRALADHYSAESLSLHTRKLAIDGPFQGAASSSLNFLQSTPILFFTAGSGIAPALAMILKNSKSESEINHVLAWSVRLGPKDPLMSSKNLSFMSTMPKGVTILVYETKWTPYVDGKPQITPERIEDFVSRATSSRLVEDFYSRPSTSTLVGDILAKNSSSPGVTGIISSRQPKVEDINQGIGSLALLDVESSNVLKSSSLQPMVHHQRVDFHQVLNEYVKDTGILSTVFICGPPGYTRDALKATKQFQKKSNIRLNIIQASFEI